MDEAFLAWGALDEAAEIFDAGDATVIEFSHLDRCAAATTSTAAAEAVNLRDGPRHRVAIVRVDEHLAGVVLGNVDLRTGRFRDAANRFTTRSDQQADLFRIDLDRLNPGREFAEVGARCGERAEHDLQDFD